MGRPKKIPAVVRAPKYGQFNFITAGKEYEVQMIALEDFAFVILDDNGESSDCLLKDCAYLRCIKTGRQYQWKIIKTKKP